MCMLRQVTTSTAARTTAGSTAHASSLGRRDDARRRERTIAMWAATQRRTAAQNIDWATKAGTVSRRGETEATTSES